MKKIHTRAKRKMGLSTHLKHRYFLHLSVGRKKRPKTFRTEESANEWALKHGLKPEQYYLKSVKHNKKLEVIHFHPGKLFRR